ncbi:MAG: hypothetical protein OHK0022_35740 [Roseiflexaceae bacterium]
MPERVYTGETSRIYRARGRGLGLWLWLATPVGLLLLWLLLVGPMRVVGRAMMLNRVALIPLVLLLIVGVAAWIWSLRRRPPAAYLMVSRSGLEYRAPGVSVLSSWDQVEELERRPTPTLLLRPPALSDEPALAHTPSHAIPLDQFGYKPGGALERDLRRYAPHLFG